MKGEKEELSIRDRLSIITAMKGDYLSVRDQFALAALQGILSNSVFEQYRQTLDGVYSDERQEEALAVMCYGMADKMLVVRDVINGVVK